MRREKSTNTSGPSFSVRALDDGIIAVECPNGYSRSRPSFLVPDPPGAVAEAREVTPGRRALQTRALRVEVSGSPPRVRIYRVSPGGEDPECELRDPNPDGATVVVDRGYALYGVGASNGDTGIDRRGKAYRVHHRETGQGYNFMPWVLSARGFGLFFDSSFPMTIDLRDRFAVLGRNIRTIYFIDGPAPSQALAKLVRLTGLPPMHPAWALGYEQSSRTWMGPGELDFVTTFFRVKSIPCDGLDLLSTYGGEGGVGRHGRGFHAGYPDLYQGWNTRGTYRTYNP
ncbi:MAG: glycoside hydrolase family 31 protein, partial [Chloroflexota bacterium]|nr:glycoside hydrolase family 31 protein [Chloroflexota bacterium]